jgi:hypothetical protein
MLMDSGYVRAIVVQASSLIYTIKVPLQCSVTSMDENSNAYVSVVYRKLRNLRKRLVKVIELEALQNAGTTLDVGQREALSGKSQLEKSVADMEVILEQLKEVAAANSDASPSATASILSDKEVMSVASKLADMDLPKVSEKTVTEKSTSMVSTGMSTTSTFSTPSTCAVPVEGKAAVQMHIRSLLRALHVCSRYTTQTGKQLPVEVDFFADVALGKSAPVGTTFDATLSNSLRQVGYYLYVRSSIIVYV